MLKCDYKRDFQIYHLHNHLQIYCFWYRAEGEELKTETGWKISSLSLGELTISGKSYLEMSYIDKSSALCREHSK